MRVFRLRQVKDLPKQGGCRRVETR